MVGWPPVIATIELSRITMVTGALRDTASTKGVRPEWRKVESPMKATTCS